MIPVSKKVADRFQKTVGSFQKVLQSAKDRDINEADTVTIVADMLADVFGFDKYAEVTGEYAIKGTFCDLAVKIDNAIKYLIEVKAIGLNLKENHLRQAVNYGANQGVEWAILTNGIKWEIYQIKFERPIGCEQVCTFDFLQLSPRKIDDQQKLFLLCKEGLSKAAIEHFHEHVQAVNRFAIAATILNDPVLDVVRREMRRTSPKVKVEKEEIKNILLSEVLKRDVVEGESAKEAAKRIKKAASKPSRKISKDTREKESDPSSENSN